MIRGSMFSRNLVPVFLAFWHWSLLSTTVFFIFIDRHVCSVFFLLFLSLFLYQIVIWVGRYCQHPPDPSAASKWCRVLPPRCPRSGDPEEWWGEGVRGGSHPQWCRSSMEGSVGRQVSIGTKSVYIRTLL